MLRSLPRGRWIGGTIPYFMGFDGGLVSDQLVFATALPAVSKLRIRSYDAAALPTFPGDGLGGFSLAIFPAGSTVHATFAREGQGYPGLFHRPVVGWIAGVHLDDLHRVTPKVFNGETGEVYEDRAVVLHAELASPRAFARIDIINIFEAGNGPGITFDEDGFSVTRCRVDGREVDFATWLLENRVDTRLPLVGDWSGAALNVSFQEVLPGQPVSLYAPVFKGPTYRLAKPIENYAKRFEEAAGTAPPSALFSCNCILNFVHGELLGRRTGPFLGPVTFGEIAYVLLNQTLVYLTVRES
ncbi:MAG: hypothetical protein AB1938_06900 [Myxococcota bacterium]